MSIKPALSLPYARYCITRRNNWLKKPFQTQDKTFNYLILKAKETKFGKDHSFGEIKTYDDFKKHVPLRDYEGLRDYVDLMVQGEKDVMWPGNPLYLSKTSGTTSGAKYIPISKASMPFHIRSAKHALLSYIQETKDAKFVDGKMIFLQGSPELKKRAGIDTGRLSGIVAHHVPNYLQKNRLPSLETNLIADWEEKVDQIVEETKDQDLRLISGIPSWVQMYFERLLAATGKKTVKEVFPNFSLFVYGGVNYEPYRSRFEKMIGASIPSIELYPASEGFIAYQDSQVEEGMLLEINSGIFYEFIPMSEFGNEDPTRIALKDVELDVNYAIILNTNAGLWGYVIGDTVKFVSKDPYRIKVTGRTKHFTSAFGEHVIAEEVENAIKKASKKSNAQVVEFHVAPQTGPDSGLPYHEWFIEFAHDPNDENTFVKTLDEEMQDQNPYYKDLIVGAVLRPIVLRKVKQNGFVEFMRQRGKLGGQNKIPRLSNDRKYADELLKLMA
ncbi:MAG: GH3 auxin-responsive promoter family protein [Flavobacteriales bacterium]|nr:GH3 auxin-responsive promoter family protein [Flavobacteriales bacterium]